MSSASDGDGGGACGAQVLPVGLPSSGSVRSSGSRVRNREPYGVGTPPFFPLSFS